jgi:NitT/TauT family transport system substrate-binding protein
LKFALPISAPDQAQLWWYIPAKTGYLSKENLTVDFIPSQGGAANTTLIGAGSADLGVSGASGFLSSQNENIPLTAVATVVTQQIFDIVVPTDSKIQSYADLKGDTIGVSISLASGSYPYAQAALREAGLNPQQDVKWVPAGVGGQALSALQSGQVQALVSWDTQLATLQGLGGKFRALPRGSGHNLPSDVFIVNNNYLQANRDVVVRMGRVMLKSIVYAQENPSCAIDIFMKQFPDASASQGRDALLNGLKTRLENMKLTTEQQGKLGYMPIGGYDQFQQLMVGLGAIKATVDLPKAMKNDLIPDMFNFDVSQVKQDADACR